MCERSLSGSSAASAGTDSAVPMIASLRPTKSLAARDAPVGSTAASLVSNSLRAAASPWRGRHRVFDRAEHLAKLDCTFTPQ